MTEPMPPRLSTGYPLVDAFTPHEIDTILRAVAFLVHGEEELPEGARDLVAQTWNTMSDLDAMYPAEPTDPAPPPPAGEAELARRHMAAGGLVPAMADAVQALGEATRSGDEGRIAAAYGVVGLALFGVGAALGLDLHQAMAGAAAAVAGARPPRVTGEGSQGQ